MVKEMPNSLNSTGMEVGDPLYFKEDIQEVTELNDLEREAGFQIGDVVFIYSLGDAVVPGSKGSFDPHDRFKVKKIERLGDDNFVITVESDQYADMPLCVNKEGKNNLRSFKLVRENGE